MKQPPPQDYERPDATSPGSDASPSEVDDEGDFPSEATRVDTSMSPPRPEPRPQPAKRPDSSRAPSVIIAGTSNADPKQSSKLAALQSLSLDTGNHNASTRLPPAPRAQGGSVVPWLIAAALAAFVGYQQLWPRIHPGTQVKTEPGAATIRTEIVQAVGGSTQPFRAIGALVAKTPSSVSAPISGRIKSMKVDVGTKVKRGQAIVYLDDSAPLAELAGAHAEVRAAERDLDQQIKWLKAQAVSQVEVEKARGAVEIARAKERPIQQRIDQTRIKAPIDGNVLEVLVHEGEVAAANAPIVKLADVTQLVAELEVNEADLKKVHRGQSVDITSDAVPDRHYKAVVTQVADSIVAERGVGIVRADLTVPDQSLRFGNNVRGAFEPDHEAQAKIFIPRTATNPQGGVWIVNGDRRVTNRPVTTVPGVGSQIEVTSGLVGGERIVSDGALMHEGDVVPAAP